ncbi:GntR family transcriptional regulator [Dactylosporangium matsuzakiense]|uniref:HTH gntR-type domain-containing protein n=1 Tax=Dactylosporangium matsuzakiense TaxID=53360 RepID=A0A9W6NMU4_9ACTN|nr:GntR family transcriptional regulator [Dactylosporangium matsuzakiense]GLL02621.1 hypothetical protein GCM10017581_043630 [Dactylosporangium matsuzakiense]
MEEWAEGVRYRAIADRLRTRIGAGEYRAGCRFPPEAELAREFEVSQVTVRRALAVLREEGLIATRRGRPATVRAAPQRRAVVLEKGCVVTGRMPSEEERKELGLDRGVPILEIRCGEGRVERLNAEAVEVVAGD